MHLRWQAQFVLWGGLLLLLLQTLQTGGLTSIGQLIWGSGTSGG